MEIYHGKENRGFSGKHIICRQQQKNIYSSVVAEKGIYKCLDLKTIEQSNRKIIVKTTKAILIELDT